MERFNRYCEKHAYKPRSVLLTFAAVLLVVMTLAFLSGQGMRSVSKTSTLGLRDIGELATQAGYFTTVQTIRKSRDVLGLEVPGTRSNYVYSYDGTIKAGVDFSKVEMTVDDAAHQITITFPKFQILSTEIKEDSFVLYNDGSNPFTSLKIEDVNRGNAELKKNAQETALKNGILENARTNAELLIKGFLAGMYDMSVYEVVFLP